MIISVINHTGGELSDAEVHTAIRAINRQVAYDFAPYWSLAATLRLEGRAGPKPDTKTLADMRGDAVLYLWNGNDVDDALGYHDANHRGIPFGFVFTKLSKALGEPWTVTLSHEALEMIADPEVNLLVQGPHPAEKRFVFHWYEMCDAVQDETYDIDGIEVSNFLLPLYFTASNEVGGRNDFLGTLHKKATLSSFGINPGGYIGFFDPETGEHETVSLAHDPKAAKRMALKSRYAGTRRSVRYRNPELGAGRRGRKRAMPGIRAVDVLSATAPRTRAARKT
jgi:hypothetical protein